MYIYIYIYIYIRVCIHSCMYIFVYVYIELFIYVLWSMETPKGQFGTAQHTFMQPCRVLLSRQGAHTISVADHDKPVFHTSYSSVSSGCE